MNFAIARKTDEHIVDGHRYNCTNTYNNFIDVLDEHKEFVKVDLSDPDFLFVLNTTENTEEVSRETIDLMTDLKNALQSVSTDNAMKML